MPLLYTMEVWYHGVSFHTAHLLGTLVLILCLNVAFSFFAGLRERHSSASLAGALEDGISAVGLGIFVSIMILGLIGRIDPGLEGWHPIVGKVVLEACIVSVGITFTNFKFRQKVDERAAGEGAEPESDGRALGDEQKQLHADLMDLAAILAGAFVFAFNVAPTEEIVLIASGLAPHALLILLLASMLIAYVILYAAGFKDHKVYEKDSLFQAPLVETTMTVAGALLVSALLLILVGESGATASPSIFVAAVVALGFPAAVGAAAGRLII